MATTPKKPKLLAIVGPTASGKSNLALEVARLVPSEIIAADSRTIYKGMDIGTAKASKAEQAVVPHWGLDLIKPGQLYSAQQFKDYAQKKIDDINTRNKLAILVGGTGLYVDSVLYDFDFSLPASAERAELESKNVEELQQIIKDRQLELPQNAKNKRHLIRTIERNGLKGKKKSLRANTLLIGLMPTDEVLRQAINKRAQTIFKAGVINETEHLAQQYGRRAIELTGGIVYKICMRVLDGEISEQTAATLFQTADWQYARRQKTWFKKNNDIFWFTDKKQALAYVKSVLNT